MDDRPRATADDLEDGATPSTPSKKNSNAFAELMKPKPRPVDTPSKKTTFHGASGLGQYTIDPASFPPSRVIYYNEKFVVINDLYPKASVHLLLLPRDQSLNRLDPQDAFDDPDFLADCKAELVKVKAIAAAELRRRFGRYSAVERPRLHAMEAEEPPQVLPPGRDWEAEIISGIHANPSMSHVHIHVLSRDMRSECMRKTNHYLSFTTDFLVGLDQFPLAHDDHRRRYSHFPRAMHCWRCRKDYGNKISRLKEHLEDEFQEWVKI